MILYKKTYTFFLWIAATVMSLLASSCEEKVHSPELEKDFYLMNISLSSGNNTRAVDLVAGSEDESFLGGVTFALYYDGVFLMDLNDNIEKLEEKNKYLAKISPEEFESAFENIGETFSEDFLKEQKFQILVTANWESYDASCNTSINEDIADLWPNSTGYNFTFKSGTGSAWQPSVSNEDGIPMFGLSAKCKIIDGSEDIKINMLRALAKIEVFDVMKVPDNDYPFSIKEVTLSKSAGKGRLIPDATKNPGWNNKDIQVVSPSLPSGMTAVENIALLATTEELTYREVKATYNKWVCYVPEMDLDDEDFEDVILDIPLNEAVPHAWISLRDEIHKLEGTGYILRNGLYRFFVNVLKEKEFGFQAIIDPDPDGDINFLNIGESRWWLHKETVNDTEVEVWYKSVSYSDPSTGERIRWEKQWYYSDQGRWYKWNGNAWEQQEEASQGPYDQGPIGINSQEEFNEIIEKFGECSNFEDVSEVAAALFAKYGKTLEINGKHLKYFMLNMDVNLPLTEGQNVLLMYRDYILYGNGHTIKMNSYPNKGRYYNMGPVRDLYIEHPDGSNRIYIDKDGWVWNTDGIKGSQLTDLTGEEKSYDVIINGTYEKSTYFSPKITK